MDAFAFLQLQLWNLPAHSFIMATFDYVDSGRPRALDGLALFCTTGAVSQQRRVRYFSNTLGWSSLHGRWYIGGNPLQVRIYFHFRGDESQLRALHVQPMALEAPFFFISTNRRHSVRLRITSSAMSIGQQREHLPMLPDHTDRSCSPTINPGPEIVPELVPDAATPPPEEALNDPTTDNTMDNTVNHEIDIGIEVSNEWETL